jgi:proline dehydrogenase
MQPAIDALTLSLMLRFNTLSRPTRSLSFFSPSDSEEKTSIQPLVFGTFQAYLRRCVFLFNVPPRCNNKLKECVRTPEHLAASLAHSRQHNYALGVKLVRGAYHPHELAAHRQALSPTSSPSISKDADPPVWLTKAETDECYEKCTKVLVGAVKADVEKVKGPRIGVLFGTHNWGSCRYVLEELVNAGLARHDEQEGVLRIADEVTERVCLGQLYGTFFSLLVLRLAVD